MSEFILKTPSANANCTQSITVDIDAEHITLSDTEYGSQYVTIPLDKWQELKDGVDRLLVGFKNDANIYPAIAITKDMPREQWNDIIAAWLEDNGYSKKSLVSLDETKQNIEVFDVQSTI